jgi:hypothetical protein
MDGNPFGLTQTHYSRVGPLFGKKPTDLDTFTGASKQEIVMDTSACSGASEPDAAAYSKVLVGFAGLLTFNERVVLVLLRLRHLNSSLVRTGHLV